MYIRDTMHYKNIPPLWRLSAFCFESSLIVFYAFLALGTKLSI